MYDNNVTRYYLDYDLGLHHKIVEVNARDFNEVINDISTEFEIHIDDCGLWFHVREYSIINYWGDKQVIGAIVSSK